MREKEEKTNPYVKWLQELMRGRIKCIIREKNKENTDQIIIVESVNNDGSYAFRHINGESFFTSYVENIEIIELA